MLKNNITPMQDIENGVKSQESQSSGFRGSAGTAATFVACAVTAAVGTVLLNSTILFSAVTSYFSGFNQHADVELSGGITGGLDTSALVNGSLNSVSSNATGNLAQQVTSALPLSVRGRQTPVGGSGVDQGKDLSLVAMRPSVSEVGTHAKLQEVVPTEFIKRAINAINAINGDEIQLSTMSWSGSPAITALRNNILASFAVVWETGSSTDNVRLGLYDINGHLVRPVITLNTESVDIIYSLPTVVEGSDGSMGVFWMDSSGIQLRSINPDGTPRNSTQSQVSTGLGEYSDPKAICCAQNRYVVIARYRIDQTENWKVVVMSFYSDGTLFAPEFTISPNSAKNYFSPDVACYDIDKLVAVFQNEKTWDRPYSGIEMVRFLTNGASLGPTINVTNDGNMHVSPSVAARDSVRVDWVQGERLLCSREYNISDFSPSPVEQIFHQNTSLVGSPTVFFSPNGGEVHGFIITNEDEGTRDVFVRTRNNDTLSAPIQVSAEVVGSRVASQPSLGGDMLNNNIIVFVWRAGYSGEGATAAVARIVSVPIQEYTPLVQISNETLTIRGGQVQTTVDKVFLVQNPARFSNTNGTIEIMDSGPFRVVRADGNIPTTFTAQDIANKTPITVYYIPNTGKEKVIKYRTCDGNACSPPRKTTLAITFDVNDPQMPLGTKIGLFAGAGALVATIGIFGGVCLDMHNKKEKETQKLTSETRARHKRIKENGFGTSEQTGDQQTLKY